MSLFRNLLIEKAFDPLKVPLTFIAKEAGSSVALNVNGTLTIPNMHYRYGNDGLWMPYTAGTILTLTDVDDCVQFWNNAGALSTAQTDFANFSIQGSIGARGNIQSLLNWRSNVPAWSFFALFRDNPFLLTPPLLPGVTTDNGCYAHLFRNTGIRNFPYMGVSHAVFQSMSLMVADCDELQSADLSNIKTMGSYAFNGLFRDSNQLSEIKVGITSWVGDGFNNWVQGVSPVGTFYKPSALPEEYGVNRIPEGWTVVNID